MLRSSRNIWWLLAFCGIADAICAAMNLFMLHPDGSPVVRQFASPGTIRDMSVLALVAGICAIAVGLWNSGRNHTWLLALHGLALGGFGLIGVSPLVRGPLSFRPISLLFVLMSVSLGAFALRTASPDTKLFSVTAGVWFSFAISFVAVGFGWVRLAPPNSYWIWMGSYFGFCALFMLGLALRDLSPMPSRRYAH